MTLGKTATLRRLLLASGLPLALLAGCANTSNLDWDLRTGAAGVDTSDAARTATTARPTADSRGVLSYPTYQVVIARRGDTVATIATRVGLTAQELASYNALKPDDTLREGEVLALPRRVAAAPAPTAPAPGTSTGLDVGAIATSALDRVDSATPAASAAPAAAPAGAEPVRHKVQRGETAYTIARLYNVSPKALAEWNGLGPDLAVREGQYLIIPTARPGAAAPSPVAVTTAPGAGSPTPEPPSASTPLPDEKVAPAAEKPKDTPPSPELGKTRTAASAAAMTMPVQGSIVRAYAKGRNDGIDIQAAAGTPVKAAAAGSVAAVTKDTDGTPILVIRHADGLLTVYAGIEGLKVAKGASVTRGQVIGVTGKSNLHFEVRKGIDSVDPLPYLE